MRKKDFYKVVAAVAAFASANPNGFTFNIDKMSAQTHGFAVARAETQNSFGEEGLEKAITFALENGVQCVGGWYDSESGLYYFDATEILESEEEARTTAEENAQLAFFNIDECKEIRI